MIAPFVRSAYNYDVEEVSNETGCECCDASLAQQHMAEECDINYIVNKFLKTGEMPKNLREPQYADFDDIFDFQAAQQRIIDAKDAFNRLPAVVRSRFGGSAQEFLDFVSDEGNLDECRKMGLAVPKAAEVPVVVVDPAVSGAPGAAAKG
jgi:phage internal scaffolding protein